MYRTMTRLEFHYAFSEAGREDFSYEALDALFDYYEQLEEDLGDEIELDVILLCSVWTEYFCMADVVRDLGLTEEEIEDTYRILPVLGTGHVLLGE